MWVATATPGFCSRPLASLSTLLSPSLCCVCGLRPVGRWVGGALPLDFTEFVSLSAGDIAPLVVLGSCTVVRLALGSWGCCSPVVIETGLLVVDGPSTVSTFIPTESVVALSHAGLFFRQRLTPRSVLPLLRLDSLCAGDEGGWGWSCGCKEDSLGFSDDSKATGFTSSAFAFLVSVGAAPLSFSLSFLFDWSRTDRRKTTL